MASISFSFQKYRRFWMAAILLVCMVTFVLCTGSANEMMNWLVGVFGGNRGNVAARIDGRNVYAQDVARVRENREIANDYMRAMTEIALENLGRLKEQIDKTKDDEVKAKQLGQLKFVADVLQARLVPPRYFSGGTDSQDVIDFLLWKDQAERLGIGLVGNAVQEELGRKVFGNFARLGRDHYLLAQNKVQDTHNQASSARILEALKDEFEVEIAKLALSGLRNAALLNNYNQEFVEMDVLKLLSAAQGDLQPEIRFDLQRRVTPTPYQLYGEYKGELSQFDVALLPVRAEDFLDKVGEPSESQLKALFEIGRDVRSNPASDQVGFVAPEEVKVQYVYADPESPYFKKQARQVTALETFPPAFWGGGPAGLAAAVRYAAGQELWDASMRQLYEDRQGTIRKNLALTRPEDADEVLAYVKVLQVPLTDPHFVLPLYTKTREPDPAMAAALVGGVAPAAALPAQPARLGAAAGALAMYQAGALGVSDVSALILTKTQKEKLKDKLDLEGGIRQAVAAERQRRVPAGAGLVLAAAGPTPLNLLAKYHALDSEHQFLPFNLVEPEFREFYETSIARRQAKEVMQAVKDKLEGTRGSAEATPLLLTRLQRQFPGLEVRETDRYYSPYDIDSAPELQPLKESYLKWIGEDKGAQNVGAQNVNQLEGRVGTERAFKDDQFYRLFFDSGDPLSAGTVGTYVAREWPPTVTIPQQKLLLQEKDEQKKEEVKFSMWSLLAEKPMLFWKTGYQKAERPETLDDVRGEVVRAWKMQEARKLARKKAEEVAEQLAELRLLGKLSVLRPLEEPTAERKGDDPRAQLKEIAAKEGVKADVVNVPRVSRKVPFVPSPQLGVLYMPYQLPKDLTQGPDAAIPYPREDMAKELLQLHDFRTPVKTVAKDAKQPGSDQELDDFNASDKIFGTKQERKKSVPAPIQVLTNRPRTEYYVAIVPEEYPATFQDFHRAYTGARGLAQGLDWFVTLTHHELARRYERELTEQLRREAEVEIVDLRDAE